MSEAEIYKIGEKKRSFRIDVQSERLKCCYVLHIELCGGGGGGGDGGG